MSSFHKALVKVIALAAIGLASAQSLPRLVKDIQPNLGGYGTPKGMTPATGKLFFHTEDRTYGAEPWCSDGTPAGTRLLLDLFPGPGSSSPANLVAHPDGIFFTADDGVHGREWWWSDGTTQGTQLVADATPGPQSTEPLALAVAGGRLFYFVPSPEVEGEFELWTSDGSDPGTQPVAEGFTTPLFLNPCGDKIFFFIHKAGQPTELWTSDGTFAGTKVVTTVVEGDGGILGAAVAGNRFFYTTSKTVPSDEPAIFFKYRRRLWTSDGTAEGTHVLRDETHWSELHLTQLVPSGDRLYFVGYSPDSSFQVWSTDGSLAGTRMSQYVPPAFPGPEKLTAAGGGQVVFFYGDLLRASDGTEAGTRILPAVHVPPGQTFPLRPAGSLVYLEQNKHGFEGSGITGFYRIDAGRDLATFLPATAEIGRAADLSGTAAVGDDWYLATTAINGSDDAKLWRLPASGKAPQLLRAFKANGAVMWPGDRKVNQSMGVLGENVFFTAYSAKGAELWKSNGAAKGTRRLSAAGDYPLFGFETRGGKVYAVRGDPYGVPTFKDFHLVSTTGSLRGTRSRPLIPGDTSTPAVFFGLGGEYFSGPRDGTLPQNLMRTNGTRKGTRLVRPGEAPVVPPAQAHVFVNNTPGTGDALWVCDGSREGTKLLIDLTPGVYHSEHPRVLGRVADMTFFYGFTGETGEGLYVTEGTPEATRLVKILSNGAGLGPVLIRSFTAYQGQAYFVGRCLGVYGLWKSDATTAGTVLVKDLDGGGNLAHPEEPCLTEAGGLLFFNFRGEGGAELWKSDGSTAGTVRAADIRPGIPGSDPRNLYAANGKLYFSADDGMHGFEVWTSDGTAEGTRLVADLTGDGQSSYPENFTVCGTKLFFFAQTPSSGDELHVLD